MKVNLPSGAWMDVERPKVLRSGHLRIASMALTTIDDKARIGTRLVEITDAAMAIAVQDWSCTGSDDKVLPVPSQDMLSLEDMDPLDFVMLRNHEDVQWIRNELMDIYTKSVTPDDVDNPESPTEPSAASGPGSRADESLPARTAGRAGTKPRRTSGSPSAGAGPRSK